MTTTIRFGLSTCPNDTFAYHGLLTGKVDTRGLDFDCVLLDVQELNDGAARGEYDVAKASFHAALLLAGEYGVLPVGSALGFGVGPLLLASRPGVTPEDLPEGRVLCPGAQTTATLLYELFHRGCGRVEHAVFDRIMPALASGDADFGVCIHEGRFTYEREGLHLVEDLGTRWESETGAPLPLGGILARHDLGVDVHACVTEVLRDSLAYAAAHLDETFVTMRQHAQELDDDVIQAHVDLYVNDWTHDLGDVGRKALDEMSTRARDIGLLDESAAALRILGEASHA